ncbi:MAG: hypothetical protein LBV52_06400 [Spirochaetaceae bacterium]|nr:hypothetical protein [Spirochaetaceae bacterium]
MVTRTKAKVYSIVVLSLFSGVFLWSQDKPFPNTQSLTQLPPQTQAEKLKQQKKIEDEAIVVHLTTRVLETDKTEVWHQESDKITLPGRPVGLKVVGDNVVVAVQFTVYPRKDGKGTLLAQGQIWVDVPGEGIKYRTTMQTVPLEFGEQLFFFPLGDDETGAHIEIQVVVSKYSGDKPEK